MFDKWETICKIKKSSCEILLVKIDSTIDPRKDCFEKIASAVSKIQFNKILWIQQNIMERESLKKMEG
jgi:hypothetical protein